MTSAQVQRTLVKSPPELWAELSDPAALARHLGELGEIRITRVEPEHKVEWAAEHTSGTVQIKPSAWGTRVTLTASREQSGDSPSSPTDEPSQPPSVQPPSAGTARALPLGSLQPAVDAASTHTSTPYEPVSDAAPLSPASATPIAAEPDPAAAAAAAAAAGVANDGDRSSPPAPAGQEPLTAERTLEQGSTPLEPAGDSRRGFFARLLRRFRHEDPAEASTHASHPPEQASPPRPQPRSVAAIAQSPASGRSRDEARKPAAVAPAPLAAESPGPLAPDAMAPPTAGAHEPRVTTVPPKPLGESQTSPAEGPPMHLGGRTPEPTSVAQKPTLEVPSEEPRAPQPEGHTAPSPALGEAPADEVTAVLTSVLDRLGAAHHRPFSRA